MAQTENIESGSSRTGSTQLAASLGLSVLFLAIYGWCNWFAAQRTSVPTLFFEWERSIPFVPLMIVPYMSIDLFFVAAPFLCRSNRELATLVKRMATALIVAAVCFTVFPFRFAFARHPVSGWLGAFFDWFQGIDRPYNLLPSLHIALCLILSELYARRTRGLLRYASNLWFVLIAFSAVLTYQHHLMDVVGGFALGAYCLYFIRDPTPRLPANGNRRVGAQYAIGALLLICLMLFLWPWGAILIWPIVSLGVAAIAYFGAGPGIFRKREGRLPWTAWWAQGPVLLGHEISRLYYRRQCRAWDELTPRIWIGGVLSRGEAAAAVREGVTAVLDLTAEFSESAPFRGVNYRNIPVLDLTAPTVDQLEEMAAFIEAESSKGIVYVHCKIGYSRTAAAAIAYLLRTGKVRTIAEAVQRLRQVRPTIAIRPEVMTALNEFASKRTVCPRLHEALLQ
jgi:protein-tyrosine phosphatase/membrane-associated phospholipid phosphatase